MVSSLMLRRHGQSLLRRQCQQSVYFFPRCGSGVGVAPRFFGSKWDHDGEAGFTEGSNHTHFRVGMRTRSVAAGAPLQKQKQQQKKSGESETGGTTSGAGAAPVYDKDTHAAPMVNHMWSAEELAKHLKEQTQYEPRTVSDRFLRWVVKGLLYKGFNRMTGFNYTDPSVRSCAFRLIVLESIAGCPGMVAGVVRHFSSLRTLRRDHGWIHTLLEEAQNERMHLLICLKKFEATLLTRAAVMAAQMVVVPTLSVVYLIRPQWMHRFVGYLEETACKTYADLIRIAGTPGTRLHTAWATEPAPQLAIGYYNLKPDATWVEVLHHILADESHHRDVNHTFADIDADSPNPFMEQQIEDMRQFGQREEASIRTKDAAADSEHGKKWKA